MVSCSRWRQLRLLLWKNYVLQKRQALVTFFEIAIPAALSLVLIVIRLLVANDYIENVTEYAAYDISRLPDNLTRLDFGQWNLAYAPNVTAARDVIKLVEKRLGIVGLPFESEASLIKYLADETHLPSTLGGVVFTSPFHDNVTFPADITYKIRLKSSPRNVPLSAQENPLGGDSQWLTQWNLPTMASLGPREPSYTWGGNPGYMREGFLPLQHAVNLAIIENLSGKPPDGVDVLMKRYPYPPYNDDKFVLIIQMQLPVILMLSFVFSVLSITRAIVHEKERKLKESMKIMGLDSWLHWLAWFIVSALLLCASAIVMTTLFVVPVGEHGSVVGRSDPSVVLAFLLVYAVATVSFCCLVSVFFSKANTAAASCGPIWFLLFVPFFFLQPRYATLSLTEKLASCLLLNTGMSLGAQVIGMLEGQGTGVQWSNVAEPVSVDDSFTLLYVMLMMLVDSVIFWLLTWYIEAVFPGEFGVPQPWYFPFMPSYWCGTRQLDAADDDLRQPLLGNSSHGGKMFEAEPSGLRVGIQMCQLRKVFDKKTAVAGVSLNAYEGQITVLLGHNGAGKTTTMSMLTGLYPPTSGTAQVNGFDVRSDVRSVRSSMGLCLQHDVLFDTLTVEEHLIFFSELKGCPASDVPAEVSHMVESLGLEDKRTALSRTLSGGMKRKLSVGNALVGKSKIVILDEPTSGMDPVARRATWDLLLAERRGRTMLLTTHHMDEADLLGDRIAIMAAGELRCCGGSLFLKKRYGAGYHMTIVKDAHCDAHQVASLVRSYVPSAEMESNSGAELSFVLPSESVGSFSELFDRLDAGREKLGVCSYGASVTTMEEVFLKVGEGMDMNLKSVMRTEYNTMTRCSIDLGEVPSSSEDHMKLNGGARLYAQQFLAMFLKRALHTARAWKVIVAQLIVPCVFTAITLVVVRTLPQLRDSPSLALTLAPFGQTIVPYYVPPGGAAGLAREFAAQFDGTRARTVDVSGGGGGGAATLDEYIVRETDADVGRFLSHCIVAAMFGGGGGRAETTAYFNNQPYHASAISLGVADNALLRLFVNDSYSVTTVNHPLPRSAEAQINDVLTKNVEGFSISFNMMFGMAFLTSSFVLFLVKERESKAKHIQFISGVYSSNFWLSTFIWDFINFSIPLVCILFIFLAFNVPAYVEDEHLAYVLLLLVLYGWAMLPFVYIWSFCFSVPSTAFARLTKFNIISGIVTVLAVAILSIPSLNLEWLAVNLEWAFLVLLPNYCLGQAVQDLYNNYQFNSICDQPFVDYICEFTNMTMACCPGHCGGNCVQYTSNYLAWEKPGLGRPICFMAAQGAVFFVLLFLVEARVFRRMLYLVKKPGSVSSMQQDDSGSRVPEDDDVAEERRHVTATPLDSLFSTNMLILKGLSKNYGPLVAVDELTFAVPQGECFGLLGMNGAGKTSTFKMVTGDESISSGDAYVARYSIKTNIKNVQQNIGYCPQFDALIDHLTGRETLYMFARLRGVPEWQIPSMARYLLRALLLDLYADSYVGEYSGGTKRKLSTAVALVGDPAIVFLDEPTTGMDPVARRMLWDALSRYRVKGKCIVLTSHSMDECEALCTRIGIMVNGQLKCLGTQQHLKTKFGQGYTVLAKMAAGSAAHAEAGAAPNTQPLVQHLQQKYKGKCILKDVHLGFVHFHITDMSLKLSDIFATMEHAKAEYHLDDYSVSQTTLEQVFLNFAKAQRTEDEIAT